MLALSSLKMNEWKGLTMQSNFTYSKALGTGALVQATSAYTRTMRSTPTTCTAVSSTTANSSSTRSSFTARRITRARKGSCGHLLGGWTFSTIFTTGSGQPIEIFTTTGDGQEYGAGDNVNFFGLQTAVPIGPIKSGHAYHTAGSPGFGDGGLPVNIFADPTKAYASYRNPVLGLDNKDTSYLNGLAYWNIDFSVRKNIRITEGVAFEAPGRICNIFNTTGGSPQGMGMFSPGSFGNLLGSAQEKIRAEPVDPDRRTTSGSNHQLGGVPMTPLLHQRPHPWVRPFILGVGTVAEISGASTRSPPLPQSFRC